MQTSYVDEAPWAFWVHCSWAWFIGCFDSISSAYSARSAASFPFPAICLGRWICTDYNYNNGLPCSLPPLTLLSSSTSVSLGLFLHPLVLLCLTQVFIISNLYINPPWIILIWQYHLFVPLSDCNTYSFILSCFYYLLLFTYLCSKH